MAFSCSKIIESVGLACIEHIGGLKVEPKILYYLDIIGFFVERQGLVMPRSI